MISRRSRQGNGGLLVDQHLGLLIEAVALGGSLASWAQPGEGRRTLCWNHLPLLALLLEVMMSRNGGHRCSLGFQE